MVPSEDMPHPQPTPILSLEGTKSGCSSELQSLIQAFRSDGQVAEDALVDYIEDYLGQSIEDAYPTEWEAARDGTPQTITIDLGVDVLTLTLKQCFEPGSAPANPCQEELQILVDAVQADPSSVAAMNALIDFIEEETGSVIEEFAGDVWEQVKADGVAREATVAVCGAEVTLTIDGTLVGSTTCTALTQYQLTLEDQDYHLTPTSTGVPVVDGSGAYREMTQLPEYEVHLEHPKLMWVNPTDDPEIVLNVASSGLYNNTVSTGGRTYRPVIRINGHYTEILQRIYFFNPSAADQYSYVMRIPPVGIRLIRKSPGTESDPPALGTVSGPPTGAMLFSGTEYATISETTSQGNQDSVRLASINAISYPWPQASGQGATEAAAWSSFKSSVNTYNASRTPFQPEVVANDADRSVTVSFMERENAVYIRTFGCVTSGSADSLRYDRITVNYGGHIIYQQGVQTTAPQAMTARYSNGAYALNLMAGIQERIINSADANVGYTQTNARRVQPAQAGSFLPRVFAVEDPIAPSACPSDARCITTGPP